MEEEDGQLSAVRSLHHELTSAVEARLVAIERLCQDLENHIDAFRKLLDKTGRSDAGRQALAKGKRHPITIASGLEKRERQRC